MNYSHFRSMIENRTIDVKEFILNNYVDLGLDEINTVLIMHIYDFSQRGKQFLSLTALSKKVTLSLNDLSNRLFGLVKQGYVSINVDIDNSNKQFEYYTLDPLYDKIIKLIFNKEDKIDKDNVEIAIKDIIELFQMELGRPLSPIEIEIVSGWINVENITPKLVRQALKEAIANNVRSLKYIDRILLNWQKNNIKTVEEAQQYGKNYRKYEASGSSGNSNLEKVQDLYYNWLE